MILILLISYISYFSYYDKTDHVNLLIAPNYITIHMSSKQKAKKFNKKHRFLSIYSPVDNLNDSNFHYYSYPQPGYQQISLYRKSTKKPLTMYY